jgi:hypothetical protein
MSQQSQYDREEDQICADYNEGKITLKEYNDAMKELQRDYRDAMMQSAQDAYERELGNW